MRQEVGAEQQEQARRAAEGRRAARRRCARPSAPRCTRARRRCQDARSRPNASPPAPAAASPQPSAPSARTREQRRRRSCWPRPSLGRAPRRLGLVRGVGFLGRPAARRPWPPPWPSSWPRPRFMRMRASRDHALEGQEVVLELAAVVADERELRAHVDAVLRAGIDAQLAEHALLVVERERDPLELLAVPHGLHLDAVDRAGARAGQAVDALLLLEVVDPAVAVRDRQALVGVLHRDRLLEQVLARDLHPDQRRLDAVADVLEVAPPR